MSVEQFSRQGHQSQSVTPQPDVDPQQTSNAVDMRQMIASSGGDPDRLAQLILASGRMQDSGIWNQLHAQLGSQNAMRVHQAIMRRQQQQSAETTNGATHDRPTAPAPVHAPPASPVEQHAMRPDPIGDIIAQTTQTAHIAQAAQAPSAAEQTAPPQAGVLTEAVDREVLGVIIHAPAGVRPSAIDAVAAIISTEIAMNPVAQEQFRRRRVSIVIIPSHTAMTDLPQLAHLRGQQTFDGRDWSTVRGVGGTRSKGGRYTIAVAEESVIRTDVASAYPATYSVAMHELAHALNNVGMTRSQRHRVTELYRAHRARDRGNASGTWTDTYASENEDEYFAQATNTFFGRNQMGTNRNGRAALQETDPEMYNFLVSFYEAPTEQHGAIA